MQEVAGEEQISLIDWSRIIFKRWKVVLIVFVIAFSGSFFFNLYTTHRKMKRLKPLYTSSVKMMLGPEAIEVKTEEGRIIKRSYSFDSELSLLGSNIVAQQAVVILKEKYRDKEVKDKPVEDKLIKEVRKALMVATPSPVIAREAKNIVNISATSGDPLKAFDIVNAVVEGYRRQKKEDEARFFNDTYRTFTEQLNLARENLHKAEDVLTDFIMENEEIAKAVKVYGIAGIRGKIDVGSKRGLNEKYLELKSEISSLKDFVNSIEELAKTDSLAAHTLISKRYRYLVDLGLKDHLLAKEDELNRLLLINEEAHPEVIRTRGELRSIMNKIDTEIENAIKNMELDLDAFKSQERELSRLIETGVDKKVLAYNMLKRDIEVKRKIYNTLAEQLQRLNIGEKLRRYSETRILEPAKIPTRPSNPIDVKFSQILLFSITIAIFSSIATVYAMEMLDTSVRDVEQLEKLIDIPVLVTIPWYRRRKHKKGRRRK